ncbi:TIGR02117 family protein [Veronia pacifica]|uniref:TIGR02117 family protein n=1 Tax=Veronia pacifica TaxID=1080227 RepID=UPI001C30D196|nr:TIGR02117 family protein [Veronia pacifica]
MKVFAALMFSLLLSACSTLPKAVKSGIDYSGQGKNKVFVVSHGWHTGFVVPSTSIIQYVPELKSRFPSAPYIELGWGDKGFYQAQEITTKITLQAIFLPTDSVVHAVAVPSENIAAYFSNSDVRELKLTNAELSNLGQFISGSFARNNGLVLAQKNGIYGDSQFYKGVGSYYLMNTCNKWTAKGLQSMGLDISPMFKLTSGSVMGYLEDLAAL